MPLFTPETETKDLVLGENCSKKHNNNYSALHVKIINNNNTSIASVGDSTTVHVMCI